MTRFRGAHIALMAALLLSPSPARAQDAPLLAGSDGVAVPRRVRFVAPVYPPEAQAQGLRGIVILELVIDTRGRVASADVLRSVPPFDDAALDAVRKWEYEVTRVDGKPVSIRLTVPITFAMRLPEVTRQEGIPELRNGTIPVFPATPQTRDTVTVTAEVTLDAEGQVAEAQVKSGEPPWTEALLRALRTWRFAPEGESGVLSFRVQADFIPGSRGDAPRVALRLTGLHRSESFPAPAPVAETQPSVEGAAGPPGGQPKPSPAPSPSPTPSAPMPSGAPRAPRPASPPVEVLTAPPPPSRPAAAGSPPPPEPAVLAVRDVILAAGVPDLLKGRRPAVPPLARMGGVTGTVAVRFAVDAGGDASVHSSTGPDLLKAAAEHTVDSWVFRRTSAERIHLVAEFDYRAETASATIMFEQ